MCDQRHHNVRPTTGMHHEHAPRLTCTSQCVDRGLASTWPGVLPTQQQGCTDNATSMVCNFSNAVIYLQTTLHGWMCATTTACPVADGWSASAHGFCQNKAHALCNVAESIHTTRAIAWDVCSWLTARVLPASQASPVDLNGHLSPGGNASPPKRTGVAPDHPKCHRYW